MTAHLLIFTLSVLFFGVFGANFKLLKIVGESVTLDIKAYEIQNATDLLWLYNGEGKVLAKFDREGDTSSIPGNDDERFRGRLKLDPQNGSLTISDVSVSDSGLYELEMSSISGTKYMRFELIVIESSQRSHWMITGPVVVLVVCWIIYLCFRNRVGIL